MTTTDITASVTYRPIFILKLDGSRTSFESYEEAVQAGAESGEYRFTIDKEFRKVYGKSKDSATDTP